MKRNADTNKDELLKKYMKHLPKSMLEEAENASPAPVKASQGTIGNQRKRSGIWAVTASAAAVICFVAGITIAITLPRSGRNKEDGTMVLPTGDVTAAAATDAIPTDAKPTDSPELTAATASPDATDIAEIPTGTPDATHIVPPAATATGAVPTGTPEKTIYIPSTPTPAPTVVPTDTASDSQKEEVFDVPLYSQKSDQDIVRRVTAYYPDFVAVTEYAVGFGRPEEMVFYGRYYNDSARWDEGVYKFDEHGNRISKVYSNSEGRVESEQSRYDEYGNVEWSLILLFDENRSWSCYEREEGVFTEARRSDGYYSRVNFDRATGNVTEVWQYIPECENDIDKCFVRFYDVNGNCTMTYRLTYQNGAWIKTEYVPEAPTPTAAPATPAPTPQIPFEIPQDLQEYSVLIDNGHASDYPDLRPGKVKYGDSGFWFETVNVVKPGTYYARSVEGGELETFSIVSDVRFHFEYTGSTNYYDDNVAMEVDRVRVWLEFGSEIDRNTMKCVVSSLSATLSSDYSRFVRYGNISLLLSGEKIVFLVNDTGALTGDLLCLDRQNVRSLEILKNGGTVLLSYINVASATNIATAGDDYRFLYKDGELFKMRRVRQNTLVSSREYEGGELIRSYDASNVNNSVEFINDKDNSRTVTITIKGTKKTVVEDYYGRADLLATITKETVSESNTKYQYTETVRYFRSAGSSETRIGSETKRYVNGSSVTEIVNKYDEKGRTVSTESVTSDNTVVIRSEDVITWNENDVRVEDRSVMTNNGDIVNESVSRRSDSGELLYYYNAWHDTGYFAERVYSESGVLLIDRLYDKETGTNNWYGYAKYYDENGNLTEEKTIVLENGKWKEV